MNVIVQNLDGWAGGIESHETSHSAIQTVDFADLEHLACAKEANLGIKSGLSNSKLPETHRE